MRINNFDVKEKAEKIEKVVVQYSDGTTKEITKGAVVELKHVGNEAKLNFELTDFTYEELSILMFGILEAGVKMGIFGDDGEEGEE